MAQLRWGRTGFPDVFHAQRYAWCVVGLLMSFGCEFWAPGFRWRRFARADLGELGLLASGCPAVAVILPQSVNNPLRCTSHVYRIQVFSVAT